MSSSDEMRRRIYAALKEHYRGEDLRGGMRLWQQEFSHRTRFSQHQFALALSRQFKISSNYKQLLSSITLAMQADVSTLPEAPSDVSLDLNRKELDPARSFAMLLSRIGVNAGSFFTLDNKERVLDLLIENNFRAELAAAVIHNVTSSEGLKLISLREANSYRVVLNVVYVAICETLGPVQGDKILSDSVKETDKTEIGKIYSAGNFL
jgi:hypothetical protein